MPKSKLTGVKLASENIDNIKSLPNYKYKLIIDNRTVTIDLSVLLHHMCNLDEEERGRREQVISYADEFKERIIEKKVSPATLYSNFCKIREFLAWSDQNNINPFSEQAFRQYHNYLWQLVLTGKNDTPLWELEENKKIGIKEHTARITFQALEEGLMWCGIETFKWKKRLRKFRSGRNESNEAYSEKELPIILNRVSSYFFQLALSLLSEKPPKIIPVKICDETLNVPIKSKNNKGKAKNAKLKLDEAFNQAMTCGYFLLSYFTAFNASELTNLCHPINLKKEKSQEYYELAAFKARANKEVLSYVGGNVHKKSLEFIETLVALSLRYNKEENSKLLYFLNVNDEPKDFSIVYIQQSNINANLMLISDKASKCIPHLIKVYKNFIKTHSLGYVSYNETKKIDKRIIKEKKIISRFINKRIVTIEFAILVAAINAHHKNKGKNISLKNAMTPLHLEENEFGLKVSFYYKNGESGSFYVEKEYLNFLIDIQEYASQRQSNRKKISHYLLPFGSRAAHQQWHDMAPNLGDLFSYGVRNDEYFISLRASRFRETAAKLARRKSNRTDIDVSHILNNQYKTLMKHYSKENSYDNQLIIYQGQRIIEKISQGLSLEEGKAAIAKELKIPVIKYDELINSDGHLNGIGVGCYQQDKNEELQKGKACFDYENCLKCKYAKVVNDIDPMYRFLSFLECLEESWLYYPERFSKNLGKTIELYREIISKNISKDILNKAQFKLDSEGRHFLWDNLELSILGYKGL